MPAAFRLVKARRSGRAFDGEGARLHGGRWNSPGTAVVYTADSLALAALELLVHLEASPLLAAYVWMRVEFDRSLVRGVDPASLPPGWHAYPAPMALQQIGDAWVAEARSAVLQVPSAVVRTERNYLINPAHRDFRKLAIGRPVPFDVDPRLRR
jgi:RES domain-containing protein